MASLADLECDLCGTRFVPKTRKSTYCSHKCSKAAWYQKNKDSPRYKEQARKSSREYWKRLSSPPDRKEYYREWYLTNRGRQRESQKIYAAKYSKEAVKRARAWVKDNPDRARKNSRNASSRRRAAIQGSIYEIYTEQDIIDTYGVTCHICGGLIDMEASRRSGTDGWEQSFWKDHYIPISLGGPDTLENVRPSHGLCNLRKGATYPH